MKFSLLLTIHGWYFFNALYTRGQECETCGLLFFPVHEGPFTFSLKLQQPLKETSVLEKKYRHKDDLGLKKYEIKSSEQRV